MRGETAMPPWKQTWKGRTWKDMPGEPDGETQRMNFALYRRGLLSVEEREGLKPIVKRRVPFGDVRRSNIGAAINRAKGIAKRAREATQKGNEAL